VHSVCMLASAYGHRRGGISQLSAAKKYYLKAKLLLATEHERNKLAVLKALCLMTCRSMTDPTVICLDSLWHWLGAASRYAIHMGLHKEATYRGNQDAGTRRRMWWHLFVRMSPNAVSASALTCLPESRQAGLLLLWTAADDPYARYRRSTAVAKRLPRRTS
jgi:hypothetical protein